MPRSTAVIATAHASRYLQQLCKHFAHKVSVEFDAQHGRVDFPFGDCRLSADEKALTIDCETKTDEEMERVQGVVFDHLKRFAWREELEANWTVSA